MELAKDALKAKAAAAKLKLKTKTKLKSSVKVKSKIKKVPKSSLLQNKKQKLNNGNRISVSSTKK